MEHVSPAEAEEVAVVSCDILGHSKTDEVEQVRRVTRINEIVSTNIWRNRPEQVVWLSGGDGGHVVFRGDGWQRNAIRLMEDLVSWAGAHEVELRITGHVGRVTSTWGADCRVQIVGPGINFAGWLLRQLTCEAVVVSDAFRRAIAPVQVEMGVSCHDERLFVDRNLEPQLLYLLSLGDFRSTWLEEERSDHVELRKSLRESKGWEVLYFAKRIWQVNSKDKQVAAALEKTAGTLRPVTSDRMSFLASMLYEELAEFVRIGQLIERRPGEVICRYGDPGESMFVILRGEVGVYNIEGKGFAGVASPKHVHRPGEVVGELASVLNRDRTADLVALTGVALLAFNYEEVKKTLPPSTTRAFDMFVTERVLEHVTQVASYLVGPNRTGPLSVAAGESHVRVGAEDAWHDALLALRGHCQLITVDSGPLDLEFDHVLRNVEDPRGLYVLVSGRVRRSGSEVFLDGAQCPVLWTDMPDLLPWAAASYVRNREPKILLIGAAGIEQLELPQRQRLRSALEDAVGHVPDEYEYQVYLCHSSKDKDIVRHIRHRLEENQVRCWFDEDELHGGHSARRGMEQGLRSSRYLLVCASANLASALWANQEIDAVLHLDVDGRADPKVLVLKLNEDSVETAIPLLLQGKKWFEYQSPGDFERLVGLLKPSS